MMKEQFLSLTKSFVPPAGIQIARLLRANLRTRKAEKAFRSAAHAPEWLPDTMLPELQARYPRSWGYGYKPEDYLNRALERKSQMAPFTPESVKRTIEIAAHDGMVSSLFAQEGAQATVVELGGDRLDPRARAAGVDHLAADAARLPYSDNSADFVFSYNAFEHFSDPAGVLNEAIRVTRPGGVLYFRFGPLYRSAYGLHAMHAITIPFVQYLFSRDVMDAYTKSNDLRRIEYETLNEWSLDQFRALWTSVSDRTQRILYREIPDVNGLNLIESFPSCFRSKVERMEDLTTGTIEIALQVT
jgi:SAM-dependent methyltransferase